jgi:hypothetical protein
MYEEGMADYQLIKKYLEEKLKYIEDDCDPDRKLKDKEYNFHDGDEIGLQLMTPRLEYSRIQIFIKKWDEKTPSLDLDLNREIFTDFAFADLTVVIGECKNIFRDIYNLKKIKVEVTMDGERTKEVLSRLGITKNKKLEYELII